MKNQKKHPGFGYDLLEQKLFPGLRKAAPRRTPAIELKLFEKAQWIFLVFRIPMTIVVLTRYSTDVTTVMTRFRRHWMTTNGSLHGRSTCLASSGA
ncbi:MAG: hypothetical protein JSW47_17130 [Phycisphaerales bacterium]|nr:MAG: hypothetical protein JSW47_17130 [Phycisphaerales bacterium]